MIFYTFEFVLFLASAVFYYRAAEFENIPGMYWAVPSMLVYLITWLGLSWTWFGCLLGQIALFASITAVRYFRNK